MQIQQIHSDSQKEEIASRILYSLPKWFGMEDSLQEYLQQISSTSFFVATIEQSHVGFLALKETSNHTTEIFVMGILSDFHGQGIGTSLFHFAKSYAISTGYSFLQVKTVQMGKYSQYDQTNLFYQHLGFKKFELFPNLWDIHNPCQIYIMAL